MARYTGPKVRKARRYGFPFTEKDSKTLMKRNYPPGMHGQNRSRLSEYGMQLNEKQKAKWTYGLLERQFRKYFEQASKKKGVTGDTLLQILEFRLDNIVYRLGFAASRAQARQTVSHGFFEVNGKRVNIPSYQVRVGDIIFFKESKKKGKYFGMLQQKLQNAKTQDWLELDPKKVVGKVLSVPAPEQMDNKINTQLIVEYYSR